MSFSSLIAQYKTLREQPAWKLLAATTAPEILAALQILLFDNERRVKESVLIERLQRMYDDLETGTVTREMILAKLNSWRNDKYITRQFIEGDEEPYCELTPSAFDAISFISSQTQERIAPTSSRLGLLLFAIRKLVDDTDTDISKRLQRIEKEKAVLEQKITDVSQGNIEMPSDTEIRAQVQDILNLLEGMDGDFLRVRDRLISLSNNIQASLLSDSESINTILEDVFKGYDAIQESEEGKTFESFYQFLIRELAGREVDSLLEELETRYFWEDLSRNEAETLSGIVSHLNSRSRDTLIVMKRLAAGLRQLVQTRNYQENRRLKQLLQKTRKLSVKAVQEGAVNTNTELITSDQTFIRLSSLASGSLYDPSSNRTEDDVGMSIPGIFDETLLGSQLMASEIDFNYLRSTIERALKEQSPVTLGQVIKKFPPKQGLASVVGYIHIAKAKAEPNEAETEIIQWKNRWDEEVQAAIPMFIFSSTDLDSDGKLR